MAQFAQFKGAQVGYGPCHPTHPNLSIAGDIASFVEHYSFLQHDTDYISFLEIFAGARILSPQSSWMVDILGFADVCALMTAPEGEIVDEEGVLLFSYIVLEERPAGSQQISFGFDATQQRRPGVYRTMAEYAYQWQWYCPSFLIWLERLIQYQGRLDEP